MNELYNKNGCKLEWVGNYTFKSSLKTVGRQTFVKCIKWCGIVYVPYHSGRYRDDCNQTYYRFTNDILKLHKQPHINITDNEIRAIGGIVY